MVLEAEGRVGMMEYSLEWGILECGSVDVACDPVIVEDGVALQEIMNIMF